MNYQPQFPEIAIKPGVARQLSKIREEAYEAIEAYLAVESEERVAEEVFDTIQACETALAILRPSVDLGEVFRGVIAKNKNRGYYGLKTSLNDVLEGDTEIPAALPCPFCGSRNVLVVDDELYMAYCDDCEARTRWCETEEAAIAEWNRRPGACDTEDSI